jgi:hypothetical protein
MSDALNELRKATLASYLSKAGGRIRSGTKIGMDFQNDAYKDMAIANKHHPNMVTPGFEKDPEKLAAAEKRMNTNMDLAKTFKRDAANRIKGIARAGRLLAKEDSEQVNEGESNLGGKVKSDAHYAKMASHAYPSTSKKWTPAQRNKLRKQHIAKMKAGGDPDDLDESSQINEISRSTIAKVATARYQQAQTALKAKDFGGYVKKMGKAIKAADKTTPNVGWSPEDDTTKKNEETKPSPLSDPRSAGERYYDARKARLKKDYASGRGMRAYGDPPKGNVDYPNDPRNPKPKKVGE